MAKHSYIKIFHFSRFSNLCTKMLKTLSKCVKLLPMSAVFMIKIKHDHHYTKNEVFH